MYDASMRQEMKATIFKACKLFIKIKIVTIYTESYTNPYIKFDSKCLFDQKGEKRASCCKISFI